MHIVQVRKFGGTSVGSPARMHTLVKLIISDEPLVIVLSAVSGTTNLLVEIAEAFAKKEPEQAITLINSLQNMYRNFIAELLQTNEHRKEAETFVISVFDAVKSLSGAAFGIREEKFTLAQGEILSTNLFSLLLQERGIQHVLLSALEFMRLDESGEPDMPYLIENLNTELSKHSNNKLFITQGYICKNDYGEIDNLRRGGSDYSASLIGAALKCQEIQIWTDIDGMHNNDPRMVDRTRPVAELSFNEAAELAYFGAKILHPQSVLPAQKYNVPVRLLNTMQPEAPGTLIYNTGKSNEIKAVAAKDGITAIKIRSGRMLLAYGFLRNVFEVFERYRTPIDMITTSEVAVSITIDDTSNLGSIADELRSFGTVEIEHHLTIVCVVGDFLADKQGYALQVIQALANTPLRMISYGGSDNNVSFLINSAHKKQALQALNDGLFFHTKEPQVL